MQRRVRQQWRTAQLLVAAVVMFGCAERATGPGGPPGEFVLTASVIGTTVSTLVVEVTAPDITTPLAFNIEAANGVAVGTIRIPPGDDRTITVRAFDSFGQLTHEGSKTISVKPGPNPPVSIPVVSRAGQVPINAVMGPVSVVVSPADTALAIGNTLQLAVTITAPNGDVLPGAAQFATLNPTIATVDANGVVTAVGEGAVQIVATFSGVGGAALIHVAPRLAVVGGTTLTLYDESTVGTVATFTLPEEGLSVTSAGDGIVYVGTLNGSIYAVTVGTGDIQSVTTALSGPIYGLSLRSGILYASGSGMADVQAVTVAGVSQPSIASPAGANLRSTAFGPDGSFYLTSFSGGPVQRWTPGFIAAGAFGSGTGLTAAFGVDVRSNGNVVVADQNAAQYFVFSATGTFDTSVPVACGGQLRGVAVDFSDNSWIACNGQNAVVKFSPAGAEVARITVGSPSGVAIY